MVREALQAVALLRFPDECHFNYRSPNTVACYEAISAFLEQHVN